MDFFLLNLIIYYAEHFVYRLVHFSRASHHKKLCITSKNIENIDSTMLIQYRERFYESNNLLFPDPKTQFNWKRVILCKNKIKRFKHTLNNLSLYNALLSQMSCACHPVDSERAPILFIPINIRIIKAYPTGRANWQRTHPILNTEKRK